MQESYDDERQKYPAFGLADYFVKHFTNSQFEYGSNQLGVCRYPLDSEGKRLVYELDRQTSAHACGAGFADKSEPVAPITINKGDTPNSIYFIIYSAIDDIYSEHFGDLDCDNISAFISRFNQHLSLLHKVNPEGLFKKFVCSDFIVSFSFKYDHTSKKISRVASISFLNQNALPSLNSSKYYITNNKLSFKENMKRIDAEFFKRYYKHKIQEAMPDQSVKELNELVDISKWSEHLKSLVEISYI